MLSSSAGQHYKFVSLGQASISVLCAGCFKNKSLALAAACPFLREVSRGHVCIAMPLTPDLRSPVPRLFHLIFYMRDGDKVIECFVLPSALRVLDGTDVRSDADMVHAFIRHAPRLYRIASAKYDQNRRTPVIASSDVR